MNYKTPLHKEKIRKERENRIEIGLLSFALALAGFTVAYVVGSALMR